MEDSLVVEEGMLVKFPLVPFVTCLLHLQLLLQGFFTKKKLSNHIVEIHKDTKSRIWGWDLITCYSPPFPVCQNSATTVAKTSFKKTSCLFTCRWSMEPAISKNTARQISG